MFCVYNELYLPGTQRQDVYSLYMNIFVENAFMKLDGLIHTANLILLTCDMYEYGGLSCWENLVNKILMLSVVFLNWLQFLKHCICLSMSRMSVPFWNSLKWVATQIVFVTSELHYCCSASGASPLTGRGQVQWSVCRGSLPNVPTDYY